MQRFQHILFVTHGFEHEANAIKQALKLAVENQAQLKILIICPRLPETLDPYKDSYQQTLIDNVKKAISKAESQLDKTIPVQGIVVEFENGTPHLIRIISRIIHDKHDLLMKAVESGKMNEGFKALDLELVRKCPCPVWLCRDKKEEIAAHIGVAIDPQSEEDVGKELAIKLLKVADQLASKSGSPLSIITCWDFPFENTLRRSPFIRIPEDQIQNFVHQHEMDCRKALDALIKKARMTSQLNVVLKRGVADDMIPTVLTEQQIDLLIMGTVGRTGIPGFVIGNTAVNVLQKISCSLLALKPKGFISTVKPQSLP